MKSLKVAGHMALALTTAMTAAAVAQTAPAGAPVFPSAKVAAVAPNAALPALFEKSCTSCHDIAQATSQQGDVADWHATIERMVGYGATLSPEDQAQLAKYLASKYGTTPAK